MTVGQDSTARRDEVSAGLTRVEERIARQAVPGETFS